MVTGIGLDIVELKRIRELNGRSAKLRERVLTPRELEEYAAVPVIRQAEFLAGRFAAKEAFAKALGTGIGRSCSFQDIEIRKNTEGKPHVVFKQQAIGLLSITHTHDYAAAQVLLQSSEGWE
ncbi:holo-ACP synthase [Planococcus lenghuensis]|uniref:Holo-[acyl-carrier-protein] synthase n=1 Tax=Planococcus lenghuensis TaxID=2213202 RepID=A0A1Q2KV91_9BACL|nr:holo-ACP synthase [Planococcus lenghuensis]AQQ52138.1 holo-[acyl-carrier-protein] synthase [Planococcus lenghuensis]